MSPTGSSATERSPLLRPTSPASSAGGSRLNPLAASFAFVPKQAQRQKDDAALVSYAQVAKEGSGVVGTSPKGDTRREGEREGEGEVSGSPTPTRPSWAEVVKQHAAQSPNEPQHELPTQHQAKQAEDDNDNDDQDADEDDEGSSCHTCSSSSSTSSGASLLPSRRSFYRAHVLLQFPPTALLVLAAFLALALWRREVRWADLLLGAAAWLASEALKEATFSTLSREATGPDGRPVAGSGLALPTLAHAVVQEAIRLGGIACAVGLLPDPPHTSLSTTLAMPPLPPRGPSHGGPGRRPLPPLDTLFFSALWFALGWAAVEIVWGCRDFWRRMRLYDDVLVDREGDEEEGDAGGAGEVAELEAEAREAGAHGNGNAGGHKAGQAWGGSEGSGSTTYGTIAVGNGNGRAQRVDEDDAGSASSILSDEEEEEALMEARMRAVEREEVEGQLGVPLFDVPVGVVVVWRVDS